MNPTDYRVLVCITVRESPDHAVFIHALDAVKTEPRAQLCVESSIYSAAIARNKAVTDCLTAAHHDGKPFTHLMFVDNDVLIPRSAVMELLAVGADIATGCYPCVCRQFGLEVPFVAVQKDPQSDYRQAWKTDAPIITGWHYTWFTGIRETSYCGAGCLLIHRKVFEKLSFPWFRWPEHWDGKRYRFWGDDMDFCERAREQGFKIFAHGDVRCGHIKSLDLSSQVVEQGQAPHNVAWRGPNTFGWASHWESHAEALKAIASRFNIRNVVEFGAGRFSTLTFLDRANFPHLESLTSVEHDRRWIDLIDGQVNGETRLHWIKLPIESMPDFPIPQGTDLVMVDHGSVLVRWQLDRVCLLERLTGNGFMIIAHDTEQEEIGAAIERFAFKTTHKPKDGRPWTTVASNTIDVTALNLEAL